MDTLNKSFNNASNAMWSDLHSNRTPDQLVEQHGEEPLSGIQGKGTATDPYDAGNRDEQPGAPNTRDNTAVIPEPLASINDDHARNPKSPSNADLGPKNVFVDDPRREQNMGYPMGATATTGKRQSQMTGVPEQRNPTSAYGQGSQNTQNAKDLAGSSSGTGGAYGYSGQGGQDTLAVRDKMSSQKDKELPGQSSTSAGGAVQSTTDTQGTKSMQPKEDEPISPTTTEGVDKEVTKTKSNEARGLRKEKQSADMSAFGGVDKEGAKSKLDDKATEMKQKEKSSMDKTISAGGIADSTQPGKKGKADGEDGSASQDNKEKESVDATKKAAENNEVSEEALKGPQTPAPREPFEFEKRLDEKGGRRSKAGADGDAGKDTSKRSSNGSKSSSSSHHSNPITQLKEKMGKVLHHNKS
ncbi:hypothetical protein BO71DRAFT_399522 [Aspergillus ellipticus CBS 707.79]|uniref:Glycine-rich cell wall structural protein 1 n=1 Tax=Aspergillus ellipticus CBS 707.79 TaxID=1448320 RepID=A0A319D8U1_9EURO|nr:hypothetical protein BO71DRAFT_399522 [Aspergillus ellipticus CBS 707.79]